MPTFTALVRVVHMESWDVDAKDEAEARQKISDMHDDVITDDAGGETVDWEVYSLRQRP